MPLQPCSILLLSFVNSKLTLHRSLRPRRSQKPHSTDHKILKRLITRLPLLRHVFRETRYLRRWILVFPFERRFEFWSLIDFARLPIEKVGFVSPLLVGRGEGGGEAF